MSRVFFISDLHFNHLNMALKRGFNNIEDHDNLIIQNWNNTITKQDVVYILGDLTLEKTDLSIIKKLNGNKNLILGNHDCASISEYLKYFNKVFGIKKYKGYWLSHCPIHPSELRGKKNIHGHIHDLNITLDDETLDDRYINVSCEQINYTPILFEKLKKLNY